MKTPLFFALAAELYIMIVVTVITRVMPRFAGEPDSVFAPITALSVLVLSVALMAYLFFSVPIREYLDGNKERAVRFLLKTIAYFAVCTVLAGLAAIIFSRM
jgi:Na+/H+-dicarboxylate symporter